MSTHDSQVDFVGEENLVRLRDEFAMAALTGMYTTAAAPCLSGLQGHEQITAQSAYLMADAMLAARVK